MRIHIFFLSALTAIFLFSNPCFAQQPPVDSLEIKFAAEKDDSVKLSMLLKAGKAAALSNREKAESYAERAFAFAKEKKSTKFEAAAYRLQGTIHYYNDEFYKAIEVYTKAIELAIGDNNEKANAAQYRNVALCYTKLGNHSKAADFYFKSLKTAESFSDTIAICNIYNDLGNLFYRQKKTDNARAYYIKAYNMHRIINGESGMAVAFNNIGSTYSEEKDYSFALVYFLKSFEIRKKIGDTLGLITSYTNIAQINSLRHDYKKSLENNFEALKLAEAIKYNYAIANVYSSLASAYEDMKDYTKAAEFGNKSLRLFEKMADIERKMEIHKDLYEIYDAGNKPGLAMKHYRQFLSFRDSINNEENMKRSVQLQMQYDFDKKQIADSIQTIEKTKLEEIKHQEEIAQQKGYMYGGVIGFALMIIVSAVSFKAYRQKRKDNFLITEQKLLVEEKQKEVLDSIHYARRIQTSLMPSEKYIERSLSRLKKW